VAISVTPTAYGHAASQAFLDAVALAKHDDPLAPVTVIVPTNSVGVSARRRLASGELGRVTPTARGVVGVTFLTVYRLAELLGAPHLAAATRRPVSTPVIAAAVRASLAREPGLFAPVVDHPATEEALVGAYRELSDLDGAQLDLLAGRHARARDVVRLYRATHSRLEADWYDEHDLMEAAVEAVAADGRVAGSFGAIVCFLPQRWTASAARLLRALSARTSIEIVAGFTGVTPADEPVHRSLARIGALADEAAVATITPEPPTEVWDASDPDDEVRAIVRGVVDALRAGVPLERMAVLYASDEPYARLLHEHLDLAAVAHNGATTRSMSEAVLGRGLLRLLALADNDFARDDVCSLFAAVPVLDGRGRTVPAGRWERLSRAAGVVRGATQWSERLTAHAAELDARDRAFDRDQTEALREFVERLAADVDPAHMPRTWQELARFAHRLVGRYFGNENRRESWPAFEQVAARRVEAIIDRLGTLDGVDPNPTPGTFRRMFELELDAARDRIGRLGDGLLVGPVGMALGVDLDRLFVCGLAEGLFPAVPHEDPLLGDRERAALGGELRLSSDRTSDDERAFLAALASTDGARVCTYPRGDLRRTTERVPSRFLAAHDAVLAAARSNPSYAFGVTHVEFPASRHELEVRAAVAGDAWVAQVPALARAVELTEARASDRLTRFDGNLTELGARLEPIHPSATGRVTSPTRLEHWAICPHAYFVQHVLGVEPIEEPEDIMQLEPIARGRLVHEILDRFLAETRGRPDAGRPWTPEERARLQSLAREVCASAEAHGLTGRRLLWHRDRRALLAELDAFLDADEEYRNENGAETLATELSFGFGGGNGTGAGDAGAVEIPLGPGRSLVVRGKADRVDRLADGALVVIDYKTGSEKKFRGLDHDHPVTAGQHLQLPVYAYAARRAFGDDASPVVAYYWFVGRGHNRRVGYEVDAPVDEEFSDTLRIIIDGIEGGVFPAIPPEPAPTPFVKCPYCDPDGMGTADRWREWERKCDAPEMELLQRLAGTGPEADAPEGDGSEDDRA
jgi:RecB family exonuclease